MLFKIVSAFVLIAIISVSAQQQQYSQQLPSRGYAVNPQGQVFNEPLDYNSRSGRNLVQQRGPGYGASHNNIKVRKTVNTAEAPVSGFMMVEDSPDSILDRGILVSRKTIQEALAEYEQDEARNRNGAAPPQVAASTFNYRRIEQPDPWRPVGASGPQYAYRYQ